MREKFSDQLKAIVFLLVFAAFSLTASCRSSPTDLRTFAPRESVLYLETNDVAALLESLTARPAFQTLAAGRTDFSALAGVQTAVVVSGFETSEENAVLNLKPRFVAIIETHSWNWQAVSLVENQIDNLVRKNYGAAAKVEQIDKNGGEFFTWTAADKRQTFAFVKSGIIYFGNDAATVERCLAVKANPAESLAQNADFARAYSNKNLAFGYVSTAGIEQIAALAGVSVAVNASDSASEKSFIGSVVPQILQNSIRQIVWTANRTENGIEDKYAVSLTGELSVELRNSLTSGAISPNDFSRFLSPDVVSATRYNPREPLTAWRESLALTTANLDALNGKILNKFSGKTLEPYGIADAETFLDAVDAPIVTAQFDGENEKSVTIAAIKDLGKLKNSIAPEINFKKPPENFAAAEVRFSEDRNRAAAIVGNIFILGDGESVLKCLQNSRNAAPTTNNPAFQRFVNNSSAAAITYGKDSDSTASLVDLLAKTKIENRKLTTFYTTETRLTAESFERVTVSDYGLIGTILKNLN